MRLCEEHQKLLPDGAILQIRDVHRGEVSVDVLTIDGRTVLREAIVPLVDVRLDIGEAVIFLHNPQPGTFWQEWQLVDELGLFQRAVHGRAPQPIAVRPCQIMLNGTVPLWCLLTREEEFRLDRAWPDGGRIVVAASTSPDGTGRRLYTFDAASIASYRTWPFLDQLPVPPEHLLP
ncbi:hypothetical protein [Nonomuraea sp. NPDC023979]|uniref:hypothetical protein n=1 Tax=Nonomuraea sp. NPDC023979 TaxID=3154796 RepID=UPI0033C3F663